MIAGPLHRTECRPGEEEGRWDEGPLRCDGFWCDFTDAQAYQVDAGVKDLRYTIPGVKLVEGGACEGVIVFEGFAVGLEWFDAGPFAPGSEGKKTARDLGELLVTRGLAEVGVRTEAEGVLDVVAICGGTPNDCGDDAIIRVLHNPLENVEAAGAGHFQIEDQNIREWVEHTVVERGRYLMASTPSRTIWSGRVTPQALKARWRMNASF